MKPKLKSIVYYGSRVVQRLALFSLVGASVVYWIIVIVAAAMGEMAGQIGASRLQEPDLLNEQIKLAINTQSVTVLREAVFALGITALLLCIKRYRKYDKPLLIDSTVLVVFCVTSVALAQHFVRYFIEKM